MNRKTFLARFTGRLIHFIVCVAFCVVVLEIFNPEIVDSKIQFHPNESLFLTVFGILLGIELLVLVLIYWLERKK